MAACAHGAGYDSCPPASVAKEFNQADKAAGNLRKGSSLPARKAQFKEHNQRRGYS